MNIQKRLTYLSEHSASLTEQDQKVIARLHLKVRAKVNATNEEQEELKGLKFSQGELVARKMELHTLKESLFSYFRSKGIKNALFSLDDMLAMIGADISMLEENIYDNKDAEETIKKLVSGAISHE